MKIDRRKPVHWLLLLGFFIQCGLGAVFRAIRPRTGAGTVVLYGHKLNGNLLALYRYMLAHPEDGLRPVFLTMDRSYCDDLEAGGVESCWASGPEAGNLLGKAAALASDHGLHSLQPWRGLYQRLGLRFLDVWHGVPFKGFDADDFRVQRRYDEVWVASGFQRELYIDRFGFLPERVVATGYARTDRLVQAGPEQVAAARAALGLPPAGQLILFAPTWKQDASGRSVYPFGVDGRAFVDRLAEITARHGAGVVVRTHRNSGNMEMVSYPNVHPRPATAWPDAELVQLACDALICDWSSIAFDFLLLDRPAIFLDVEPPFRKGFSLGPEYRYGAVVDSLQALAGALEQVLSRSDEYWLEAAPRHRGIKHQVYGRFADGASSRRCIERLRFHLSNSRPAPAGAPRRGFKDVSSR